MNFHVICQVNGVLKVANVFSSPFEEKCTVSNLSIESSGLVEGTMLHYTKCTLRTSFTYSHRVHCILKTMENTIMRCVLRNDV